MKRLKKLEEKRLGNSKGRWFVLALILAAFLPFILRLGLDVNAVNRQALNRVYREWRVSPSFQELKSQGSELRLLKSDREGVFEDLFQGLLQNDFKLVGRSDVPVVASYFKKSKVLSARIEWGQADISLPVQVFHSETRFVNNGLLLGFWLSLILLFFGMESAKATALTVFFMLLWQVRWNPMEIPLYIWDEAKLCYQEILLGLYNLESSMFFVLLMLAVVVGLFQVIAKPLIRKLPDQGIPQVLLFSVLVEPMLLYLSSKVMGWGDGVYWWKVYLGSLCFRFVGVSFLLSLMIFRPKRLPAPGLKQASAWAVFMSLMLPTAFLVAGGWQWLNAVLIVDAGSSILMLKAFLTAALLAALTGSRWASLILGVFVLSWVAPPTEGHWVSAAVFGFFFEGLWMGWWLSPLKSNRIQMPMPHAKNLFFVCAGVGWVLGIFINTAGVPLALSWVLVLLSIWSYGQMDAALKQDIRDFEMETHV